MALVLGVCQADSRIVAEKFKKNHQHIVDVTPEEKLDWAMQQIQNSLEKIGKNGTNKKK